MKITRITTTHARLPVASKGRVPLNHAAPPEGHDIIAVELHADDGSTGLGFTTTTMAGKTLAALVDQELTPLVVGEDATSPERLFNKVRTRCRSIGWGGLLARAYAAIDIALWDRQAKQVGVPLGQLLGGLRTSVRCVRGDLAPLGSDPDAVLKMARPLIEQGVLGVVVEVGGGNINEDADCVQRVRDGLGEEAWLGIRVDGRYDLATAMAMAHFYEDDVGIDWLDAPIAAGDYVGYRRLAERMEVPLALGSAFSENDDFRPILEQGSVRILRPDVLRLGGITPFLKLSAQAELYHITLVPYRLPEIGVHLACGLPNVPMVECGAWLTAAFEEPCTPVKGKLNLPSQPGHGWTLNRALVG